MHSSDQVTVKITYERAGTIPPIFVAGSFTETPWEAIQLDHEIRDGQSAFSKTFDIRPGKYQYKFRLGYGDWWVCDDQRETESDENGNLNNILNVEPPASDKQELAARAHAAAAAAVTKSQHEIEYPSAEPLGQSSASQSFGLDGMDDSDGEDERSFAREAALTENPSVDMHTTDAELENDDLLTFHKANGHSSTPSAIEGRPGGSASPTHLSMIAHHSANRGSTEVHSDPAEPLASNPRLDAEDVDRDGSPAEAEHVSRKSTPSQQRSVEEDGAKNVSWLSRLFRSFFGPLASMLCAGHRNRRLILMALTAVIVPLLAWMIRG